jgi:hypothetical protein
MLPVFDGFWLGYVFTVTVGATSSMHLLMKLVTDITFDFQYICKHFFIMEYCVEMGEKKTFILSILISGCNTTKCVKSQGV